MLNCSSIVCKTGRMDVNGRDPFIMPRQTVTATALHCTLRSLLRHRRRSGSCTADSAESGDKAITRRPPTAATPGRARRQLRGSHLIVVITIAIAVLPLPSAATAITVCSLLLQMYSARPQDALLDIEQRAGAALGCSSLCRPVLPSTGLGYKAGPRLIVFRPHVPRNTPLSGGKRRNVGRSLTPLVSFI